VTLGAVGEAIVPNPKRRRATISRLAFEVHMFLLISWCPTGSTSIAGAGLSCEWKQGVLSIDGQEERGHEKEEQSFQSRPFPPSSNWNKVENKSRFAIYNNLEYSRCFVP